MRFRCRHFAFSLVSLYTTVVLLHKNINLVRPYLSIAMDLGSDGNAGFHALERLYNLNIDQANDQNHGCNCDWKQMENDVGAKAMMTLNVVAWNINFWAEKRRGSTTTSISILPSEKLYEKPEHYPALQQPLR